MKKSVLTSILVIALCFSIIAGATFALFTSESKVNVAVTAGNVEVVATIENEALSSTLGANVAQTAYTVDGNTITLVKMIPGDTLSFDIRIENKSDVAVSYKTIIEKIADDGLWSGLEVSIDGNTYDGNKKTSAWTVAIPGSADIVVPVKIALPELAGNEYMKKTCSFSYCVEAVQGNVATEELVEDPADVDKALLQGSDVTLLNDLTLSVNDTTANSGYKGGTGLVVNGGNFNGNGNTLTVTDANRDWACAISPKSGTIENMTVNGSFRGIFMSGANGDVYIDNVTFKNVVYTFNSDSGSKDYGVYISNSTLNGWTSYSNAHKEVVFTDCAFGEGSGYAFCRPYNASVFTNCVFAEGFEFDTSKTSEIVFNNCYYGDTLITAENAASLCYGETVFFYNGLNGITIQ